MLQLQSSLSTPTSQADEDIQHAEAQIPVPSVLTNPLPPVNSLPTPAVPLTTQLEQEVDEASNLDFTIPPLELPSFTQRAPDSPFRDLPLADAPPEGLPPEYIPMHGTPPALYAALSNAEERPYLTRFWRNVQRRRWARAAREAREALEIIRPQTSNSEYESESGASSSLSSSP